MSEFTGIIRSKYSGDNISKASEAIPFLTPLVRETSFRIQKTAHVFKNSEKNIGTEIGIDEMLMMYEPPNPFENCPKPEQGIIESAFKRLPTPESEFNLEDFAFGIKVFLGISYSNTTAADVFLPEKIEEIYKKATEIGISSETLDQHFLSVICLISDFLQDEENDAKLFE